MSEKEPVLLHKFEVKGYRNLTETITLHPLGRINVIHGPNNVGKSNLLQSIDLYFDHLSLFKYEKTPSITVKLTRIETHFNRFEYQPITINASFLNSSKQLKFQAEKVQTNEIRLTLDDLSSEIQLKPLDIKFSLIDVSRRMKGDTESDDHSHIVPQTLRDAIFDAKESLIADDVRRWETFVEALKAFESVLGKGRFDTAFDRKENKANLVYDQKYARIPIDLLGSGIQQIVALLGHLLMTEADIVGIEEPELNLRYALQKQLLVAFDTITRSEFGPNQIIMTSHSPAFENGEGTFFAMEPNEDGVPTLTHRSQDYLPHILGDPSLERDYATRYNQAPTPTSYVSAEGLVLLPEKMQTALHLENGGGVVFTQNKETQRYEIWTLDELAQYLNGNHDSE